MTIQMSRAETVDKKGAAEILGCSPRTVERLVKQKKLYQTVRIGRKNRYLVTDCLRLAGLLRAA